MRFSGRWYGFLLNLPGLVIVLLWVLFPAFLLVYTSFIRYDNVRPIVFTGLGNYIALFQHRLFWLSCQKVAIFCVSTTTLTLFGGMALALSMARITKGAWFFRSLLILPWAVPAVISGIIWKWMFSPDFGVISDLLMKIGLIDAPLSIYGNFDMAMVGIIVADSWTRMPFMGIILLAALLSVSPVLYEAAMVDGAGALHRFAFITLPLIKGPAMVGLLITTMFSFRTIDIIMPLTAGGPGRATYVFGYYIWDQIIKTLNFGMAAAGGMVLFFMTSLIAAIFVYLSRREA
jgi:ABC-type sugar transport system permease subunit